MPPQAASCKSLSFAWMRKTSLMQLYKCDFLPGEYHILVGSQKIKLLFLLAENCFWRGKAVLGFGAFFPKQNTVFGCFFSPPVVRNCPCDTHSQFSPATKLVSHWISHLDEESHALPGELVKCYPGPHLPEPIKQPVMEELSPGARNHKDINPFVVKLG